MGGNGTGGSDIRSYLTDHIRTTEKPPTAAAHLAAGGSLPAWNAPSAEPPDSALTPPLLPHSTATTKPKRLTSAPPSARSAVYRNRVMMVAGLVVTLAALLPTAAA